MKKIAMTLVLALGVVGSAFAHSGNPCAPRCAAPCAQPCKKSCCPQGYYPGQTFCKQGFGLRLPSLCLPKVCLPNPCGGY
jgi:hypothetical protein